MEQSRAGVHFISLLIAAFALVPETVSWQNDADKVLLSDIKVLSLYHGRVTNAKRSSPIPQIKCVGGTAGCQSFVPQVVQCYNKGTDGYDVQWQCQTDMDNAYRFGQITVSCEGYDYADDPYVLKGSCGLEYTLDLTKEGFGHHQHSYYGSNDHNRHSDHSYTKAHHQGSGFLSQIITLAVIGIIIYALYTTCLSSDGRASADQSGGFADSARGFDSRPPPPPGFREEYMPGGGCSTSYSNYGGAARSTGGGFWTGAATGGLLGYMFGSRGTGSHYAAYQSPSSSTWGTRSTAFGSSTSTGTRTASGFGGTKRR